MSIRIRSRPPSRAAATASLPSRAGAGVEAEALELATDQVAVDVDVLGDEHPGAGRARQRLGACRLRLGLGRQHGAGVAGDRGEDQLGEATTPDGQLQRRDRAAHRPGDRHHRQPRRQHAGELPVDQGHVGPRLVGELAQGRAGRRNRDLGPERGELGAERVDDAALRAGQHDPLARQGTRLEARDPGAGEAQRHGHRRAGAELALELDVAAHQAGELARDHEAEAGAAVLGAEPGVGLGEGAEQARLLLRRDPGPVSEIEIETVRP